MGTHSDVYVKYADSWGSIRRRVTPNFSFRLVSPLSNNWKGTIQTRILRSFQYGPDRGRTKVGVELGTRESRPVSQTCVTEGRTVTRKRIRLGRHTVQQQEGRRINWKLEGTLDPQIRSEGEDWKDYFSQGVVPRGSPGTRSKVIVVAKINCTWI